MNRGFGYYYKNSIKRSKEALVKKKGHISYYFYLILSALAKATLLFAPAFALADIAFVKLVKKDGKVQPLKAISSSNGFSSYFSSFMANLLQGLIFLAGLLIIVAFGGLLYYVGTLVAYFAPNSTEIILVAFLLPVALVLLVYLFLFPILFAATSYVIETNPDVGFGKALMLSFKALRSKGKATLVASLFWPTVLMGLIIAGAFLVLVALFLFFSKSAYYWIIFYSALAILVLLLLYILPIFQLTSSLCLVNLFDDIFGMPNQDYSVKGVNIRGFKQKKIKKADIDRNLVSLFDNTPNHISPLQEKPSTKENKVVEVKKEEIKTVVEVKEKPTVQSVKEPSKKELKALAKKEKEEAERKEKEAKAKKEEKPAEVVEQPVEEVVKQPVEEVVEQPVEEVVEQPAEEVVEQPVEEVVKQPAEEVAEQPAEEVVEQPVEEVVEEHSQEVVDSLDDVFAETEEISSEEVVEEEANEKVDSIDEIFDEEDQKETNE